MKNDAPHDDTDLNKLGELIDDIEVAMLTTLASDGSLVSRPLQTLKLRAMGKIFGRQFGKRLERMPLARAASRPAASAAPV